MSTGLTSPHEYLPYFMRIESIDLMEFFIGKRKKKRKYFFFVCKSWFEMAKELGSSMGKKIFCSITTDERFTLN